MEILKVSSKTNPNKLAGAIAGCLKEKTALHLQYIGAGAANQTNKALAIARSFVAAEGKDIVFTVAFSEVELNGSIKTAMVITPELRG